MSRILDYSSSLIQVVVDANNIYFIDKDGASVAGVNGRLILTASTGRQFSFNPADVKSPFENSLEDLVIAVQVIIDNV